jgi:hypothetical protein
MPLEAIWWADDMEDLVRSRKHKWKWTAVILQPAMINAKTLKAAQTDLDRKKKVLPAMHLVRLQEMNEGNCAQILHTGPYSDKGPTIAKLHAFIRAKRKVMRGWHREIYLSDARRTISEKLRTFIRQPFC